MDVICINSKFSQDQLEFYSTFGVNIPKENSLYTIRQIRYDRGKHGLLLNELNNPEVPIKSLIKGVIFIEPSWDSNRFTTLLGEKISLEELESITKEN